MFSLYRHALTTTANQHRQVLADIEVISVSFINIKTIGYNITEEGRAYMHPENTQVHPSALCGRLDDLISEPTRAVGADGDRGDCDPYWPAENGQVATTQSADGCTQTHQCKCVNRYVSHKSEKSDTG